MATRCQIGFKNTSSETEPEVLVYKHWDGYPGTVDGTEHGVLTDLIPFLKFYDKARGVSDIEYCSARLLQYFCNIADKGEGLKLSKTIPTGTISYGITKSFHSDIEFYYEIIADRKIVNVFSVRSEETFQLLESISYEE